MTEYYPLVKFVTVILLGVITSLDIKNNLRVPIVNLSAFLPNNVNETVIYPPAYPSAHEKIK